jgi:tetratricopeptide (TPR) repeat protein
MNLLKLHVSPTLVAVMVLVAGFAQDTAAQAPGSSTNRLLRQAAGLEASGDLEGAERVLREVLDRNPRSVGALFSLERVLTRKGEPEAVLPLVAGFLARDPGQNQVRILELRVLSELDSLATVRERAEEWREGYPSEATYRDLVELYSSTFGAEEALSVVDEGRSALADPGLLAFEAGDLHAGMGNRDDALAEWVEGVGDDGSGVSSVARRLRALPDGRDEATATVVRALADSPVFARRRAGAALTVELRMEEEAMALTRSVADELGGRARSAFLAEIADRARELSLGAVATWAYDELGADAATPAERRAFDERLVEVSLAAGDTAAAVDAERRIARSYPTGSTDRRLSTLRALRLGMGAMDAPVLRASFDAFLEEFPGAIELDETAAAVGRELQRLGDREGAMVVLQRSDGPLSAAERAYLLLDVGRLEEAREILGLAVDGMAPSDATSTIRILTLLARLSPGSAELLAVATAAARRGEVREAVSRLEAAEGVMDDGERATLLAHAARLSEDAGDAEEAARMRATLLESHPDDPSVPEAALALARYYADQEEGTARAIEILEELIASRPNAAVVPSARAELSRLRGAP